MGILVAKKKNCCEIYDNGIKIIIYYDKFPEYKDMSKEDIIKDYLEKR